jgi:hypothetical protein
LSRGLVGVYGSYGNGIVETTNGKVYQFKIDFDNVYKDRVLLNVSGIDGYYVNLEYLDTEHIWLNLVTSHEPENVK